MNLTWKWGQGRCIPSVRLLSHQLISLIRANYTEEKLIKRNYVSANEDLGLCPPYNVICMALPDGYVYPLKASSLTQGNSDAFHIQTKQMKLWFVHQSQPSSNGMSDRSHKNKGNIYYDE